VVGRILSVEPYLVRLGPEEGEVEEVHKLQVKAAFRPDAYKRLRKAMRFDKAVEAAPTGPIARPQDRYNCSDKRLFRYLDSVAPVRVTLLEGEQLIGTVTWFSRFEFGLGLKGEAEVVIFRHALVDLTEV
jgi:sRNA-binding regulator protein Hfq